MKNTGKMGWREIENKKKTAKLRGRETTDLTAITQIKIGKGKIWKKLNYLPKK